MSERYRKPRQLSLFGWQPPEPVRSPARSRVVVLDDQLDDVAALRPWLIGDTGAAAAA
jgi:hypothetical protein